ncbi:MAG: nucleotide exchange factor GrpE [Bacillota bacterium]|jgi:molecular chaperone GrpE
MSDRNNKNGRDDRNDRVETGTAAHELQVKQPGTPEDGNKDLEARLAEEASMAADCRERLLRLQADFENYRRRTRQEREGWYRQAAEEVVSAILPVLDNFERALEHPGDRLEDFLAGVRMIYRQLDEILAEQGLERLPGAGEEFDPRKHEAVDHVETADVPENTVLEELRPGYYFKGKVMRPAMVKVAKRAVNGEVTSNE